MVKKTLMWCVTCLAVLGLFVLPAQAGIIITEGKITDEIEPTKEVDSNSGRRAAASEKASATDASDDDDDETTPGCTEFDEDGFCVQADTSVDEVNLKEVGDLNNDDPDGWDCTPIGGGIEVCEQPGGTGSSPGAGAGGGLGADVGLDGAPSVGGCQGGESGGPGWLAMTLLGLALLSRRRAMMLFMRS
jgi:uncharacterized protein (TIGR03382 family)